MDISDTNDINEQIIQNGYRDVAKSDRTFSVTK